jgi:hypothetical protein
MGGIRVNRNIGLRFTIVHRSFILAHVIKLLAGFVAIRFCSRRERPMHASQTPVNGNGGSGHRSNRGRGGGRTRPDTRCRVAAIGWGALDQLETELSENGARILGVMGRLVGRIVADHALFAIVFAAATPA